MTYAMDADEIKRCREISKGNQGLIDEIIRIVSRHTGIPTGYLKGKRRSRPISHARWLICYLAHDKQGFTLHDIGSALGMDHSSVLHGVQQERIRRARAAE